MKRTQVTEDEIRGVTERLLWNLIAEVSELRETIEQQYLTELVRIGENRVIDRKAQMKWLYDADKRILTGSPTCGDGTASAINIEGDEAEWFWSWLTNFGAQATLGEP